MNKHHKAAPIVPPPAAKPPVAPPAVARPPLKKPSEEEIRVCAYRKWEMAGKPDGDGVPFWIEAEKELTMVK